MSTKKLEKIFVFQHDHSDCGVASLLNIIKYHGGYSSFEIIRNLSGTKNVTTVLTHS